MQTGPLSYYWKTCLYDNCMITVQNSNSHLASHTVAPQITGIHDTMFFFCSCGIEEILGLRSELDGQLKKGQEAFLFGGSVREWKFLKSLSFLRSVIVTRKTVDNLAKPEETQV